MYNTLILSLLAAILILSIKTGLVLGSSWLSMPRIFGWAAVFGGSIVLFSNVFHEKYRLIGYFIDKYTFAFACIAGLLFIYLGLEYTAETGSSEKKQKIGYLLSFLPCPFCVGALVVSVIYTAGGLKMPFFTVAIAAGIAFTLGVTFVSWILRKFLHRFNFSLTNFFHQFLLLFGAFTLLSAFLIPNIVTTMQDNFIPMVLGSREQLLLCAAVFFVLFALGIGKELLKGFNILNWRR